MASIHWVFHFQRYEEQWLKTWKIPLHIAKISIENSKIFNNFHTGSKLEKIILITEVSKSQNP